MKQKFIITLNKQQDELIVEEFAELAKEYFTSININKYKNIIKEELPKGKKALISFLRNKSMFPLYECTELIVDAFIRIAESTSEESQEIYFDDKNYIQKNEDIHNDSINEDEKDDFTDMADDNIADASLDDSASDIDELLKEDEKINVSAGIKTADEDEDIEKVSSGDEKT